MPKKKTTLIKKITEYVKLSMVPEIDPEFLAGTYETTPSTIKKILSTLEKDGLIRKLGDKWLR